MKSSPTYTVRPRQSFTLIELLVVVAIIAILAALLLPSLGEAKRRAIRVECGSRLKQMAIATVIYTDESDGWFYVMDGGIRPLASPSRTDASGKAPPIPKDILALFEADLRYCPDIEAYCNETTSGILPQRRYDGEDYFNFGYYHPSGDNNFISRDLYEGNRANSYTFVIPANDANVYDFYRPFRGGHMTSGSSAYENKYYDPVDAQPLMADFITDNIIAHKGGGNPKTDNRGGGWGQGWYDYVPGDLGLPKPRGANSVWADGHVQWNTYNPGVIPFANRIMAGKYPEGWGHQTPSAANSAKYWTKQSKRVQ